MTQERAQRQPGEQEPEEAVDGLAPEDKERVGKLGEDVDDLLDEIDDVLEENAEEFVNNYVQKGGQ